MAGSNNEVKTKFSADASGFTAAIDKAQQRIKAYADSTNRTKAVLDSFQAALNESGAATLKQQQAIAQHVILMDRMAASAGKTREQLAAEKAEFLGISSAMQSYTTALDNATKHTHSFSLANAGAQRELLVLFHELSQGNFKRFGGSLMVLANRSGAMGAIFNPLTLGIGAVTAAAALSAEFVYKAAESLESYADEVEKLSQRTGQSTKDIQEWAYATRSVGMDAKDSSKSIESLGEAQNKAAHGNKNAVRAFTALGISMNEVKTASPHDLLLDVADAFQQTQDGAAKAAVASELFGASGEQLIPLLDKGRAGIAEYTNEADRLGGVLSDGTIKQLAALRDNTDAAAARMSAMSLHAKAQLIPTIEAVTAAFSDNATMGPVLDEFYAGVGFTFRTVATAAATVVTAVRHVITTLGTLGTEAKDLWDMKFSSMAADAKAGYAKVRQEGEDYAKFTKTLWADVPTPASGPPPRKRPIQYAPGENNNKGNENQLNGTLAALNTQLKSIDDSRKESLANLKTELDQNLITYRDYYTQSIAADEKFYAQEVDVQEQRLELAKQKKNIAAAQSAQQELDRINHERLSAEAKLSDDLGKEWLKRQGENQKYVDSQHAATQKRGDTYTSADASQFMTPRQKTDYQGELQIRATYYQEVARLKEQYDSGKSDYDDYQYRLQIAAQNFSTQEEQYNQHLIKEQAVRNSYGDQMQLAFTNIGAQSKTAAEYAGEAFTDTFNTANSALQNFVTTGQFNVSQFASTVIADFAKIAEQMAMMQLFKVAGAAMGFDTSGISALHFATGGHVLGAGTGTSDSIPAMLSNGEYVVNAAATSKYRSLLESINSGHAAHFATGGYVGSSASSGGSNGDNNPVSVVVNHNGGSGGLSDKDVKDLHALVQSFVDRRMSQSMRGQGGFAYQMKYGMI